MSEQITELSRDEIDAVSGGLILFPVFQSQSNTALVYQNATSSQWASNGALGGGNVQLNVQTANNANGALVGQGNFG